MTKFFSNSFIGTSIVVEKNYEMNPTIKNEKKTPAAHEDDDATYDVE